MTKQAKQAKKDTRDAREEVREETERTERVPLGGQTYKLKAPLRPGYRRYWFNDDIGRIESALAAGYKHVVEERKKGTPKWKRPAGTKETGGQRYVYLMEIPEEFYQEDQAAKQVPLDEIDADIQRGVVNGADGKDAGAFYQPGEGSSIKVTK